MKPILLATLSFFLFALTTHFSLTFTQDIDKVKDTDGNPLVPGAKYYILPTTSGRDACIEDIEASYGKVIKGVFNIEKHEFDTFEVKFVSANGNGRSVV
ncbi:hypothetical protein P8452_55619 [Trifolium repens]|nr:hypothetical protein P8452_55619 [Trifolium repens]